MTKLQHVIPKTDFRQDAAGALARVRASKARVVITPRGQAAAVISSLEAYERAEREREFLQALARGEQAIACGKGFGLERVLREAERFLVAVHGSRA